MHGPHNRQEEVYTVKFTPVLLAAMLLSGALSVPLVIRADEPGQKAEQKTVSFKVSGMI